MCSVKTTFMKKAILVIALAAISLANINADNARYVNMFLGTSGDHGQMAPGAACPLGMISVCPDSDPNQHAGYDFSVPAVSGISINRVSGIGCSGSGGNLSIRPASEDTPLNIVKGTETAHPGFTRPRLTTA